MHLQTLTDILSSSSAYQVKGGCDVKGSVRCAKCSRARSEDVCPHCGALAAYVNLYWRGKNYSFRLDANGVRFSHEGAFMLRNIINGAIADHRKGRCAFNPNDYIARGVRSNLLKNRVDQWLKEKETEASAGEFSWETLKNYRGYARIHWVPFLGNLNVREIRYEDLVSLKDHLPSTLKIKTRRNVLTALRSFYSWLRRKGIVSIIPEFPQVEGDDSSVRVALDQDAQRTALELIPDHHRDPIEFGMETGLRPGELCALKIKDLDLKKEQILIQRTWSGSRLKETTKGKKKNWIPLSDRALEILTGKVKGRFPDDFLFVNPDTKREYRPKKLNQVWREFSGISTTFYEASRHSFCTQVADASDNPYMARELMRHSDIRTTQRYYHAKTQSLKDLVNKRKEVVKLKNRRVQ